MNNIDKFTDNQAKKVALTIKRFAPFLNDFEYIGFVEKNKMNQWKFYYKFPDYIFRIIFAEKNNEWSVKIFVYWKKTTKDMTAGAGKDFDFKIGPVKSFSELIIDVDRKIKNNPVMGHHLYDDDYQLNMDKEAVPLMLKLKKSKDRLFSMRNVFFSDLKQIYKKIKNVPDDKLLHYCKIHNKSVSDKQDFLFDLQKLNKIDYYSEMQKLKHF